MSDLSSAHPSSTDAAPSGAAMDRRIDRPHRRTRRLALGAGAGVLVLAALVYGVSRLPPPASLTVKVADVQIASVATAPFQDYLPVRGAVAPLHTTFVAAVSGGEVEKVLVLDGSEVPSGAALATLTNPQLKLDVTSKEADIAGRLGDVSAQSLSLEKNRLDAESQVSQAAFDLLKAEHDYDVRRQLHDKDIVSDAELKTYADTAAYDRARLNQLKSGQAQQAALAGVQGAEIARTNEGLRESLGVVRSSLDALTIRAPVAGRLTDFQLQPGQPLKAGDTVGQIDSENAYKLTADVDEYYLGRVQPGEKATADLDGSDYALTVSRVLPQVTDGRFRVELTFDKAPPAGLRRGEGADIRITLGATRSALILPNSGWLEGAGGGSAFVVTPDGRRADRRAVGVGRRNPEQVEITSGLRPGERVVVSSYAGFDKINHLILH
jgi:HlyD family secretion protein